MEYFQWDSGVGPNRDLPVGRAWATFPPAVSPALLFYLLLSRAGAPRLHHRNTRPRIHMGPFLGRIHDCSLSLSLSFL